MMFFEEGRDRRHRKSEERFAQIERMDGHVDGAGLSPIVRSCEATPTVWQMRSTGY